MRSQVQGRPIFISYRRADAGVYATMIYEFLDERGRFEGKVFMDTDTLRPADIFTARLKQELDSCDVLIAVIGEAWLDLTTQGAQSKNRRDFASEEIEHVLNRGVSIIPVLVGQASMPDESVLPAQLQRLAVINALTLGPRPRKSDLLGLSEVVREKLAEAEARRKGGGALRRLAEWARRAWGRAKGPLRSWLVEVLRAAPYAIPTLVAPNALFIALWARWLGSRYQTFGRLDYVISDPSTYLQLALLQSATVCIYSAVWLGVYRLLRGRPHAPPPETADVEGSDTNRTEEGRDTNQTG